MSVIPGSVPPDLASAEYQKSLDKGLRSFQAAADEINLMSAKRIRKVPEHYFKANLLPLVRAWIVKDDNNPPEIGFWLNVADGLNNHIEIVDDKDQEKVLFLVPPPFCDIPMRTELPNAKRLVTVHDLVLLQGDMHDNGDQRGFWDLERQIADVCSPRPEDAAKTRYLVMLVKIYDRYNLPLEELVGSLADEIRAELKKGKTASATNALASTGSTDDDVEEEIIY